ncbi:MAG TPA: ABC-F family ATP-binding cassette domain-containing protein [Tepidisphaeraceae bacterium]|jgi:ATP-binding cassette subfamily F protein 3|nr:ABC-F family ATP-binding cassette domain-containing protein [Tepidisphaeraceae bacterium]
MAVATLSNVEKSYGQRVLLDHASLTVYEGERIGLIGPNGAGKSTIFKVLTNQIVPEAGEVAITRGVKLGHLEQDPQFDPGNTVIDEAELAFAKLHELNHKLRDLEHKMAEVEGDALEKVMEDYQNVQHEFDLEGGYAFQHKLEGTLEGVGLDRSSWEQSVTSLSGGQKSRLALAKLLIAEPDLLLLDEPTNHLDLAAIEWVENYLKDFKGAVIIISHDRYLLDRIATRIVWLNQAKLFSYTGNYSAFVEQKELQELSQQRAYEEQQEDIEKQKEFVRRFGAGQRAREAKGREKRLNRLLESDDLVQAVGQQRGINVNIDTSQRAGDQVLQVRELSKNYDTRPLWSEVSFRVVRGERIGIIGPNGSGKTTLLEALAGRREADSGVVKWGANITRGYYDQKLADFNPEFTVYDELSHGRVGTTPQEYRDILGALLFRGTDAEKRMDMLSGGERARVALAKLILDKPNVLLLDEPTNHLDIASAEALENTLRAFPGTLLFVSHDRYFLNKLSTRLLVLEPPKGVVDFDGNYEKWHEKVVADAARAAEMKAQKSKPAVKAAAKPVQKEVKQGSKKDNPYLRPFGKLTLQELEKEIQKTERGVEAAQNTLSDPKVFKDAGKAGKVQGEYEAAKAKLVALEAEYYAREQ